MKLAMELAMELCKDIVTSNNRSTRKVIDKIL